MRSIMVGLLAISCTALCSCDDSGGATPVTPTDTVILPSLPRPPASSLALPTTSENPGVAPWFKVFRPADMAAAVAVTGQRLPVVVWANGGCFRSSFTWEPLYKRWAAGGFVVLALDASPSGGMLATSTVDDHDALVDWVMAEAKKAGSPYFGKLDTDRIVAAGNSCGGVTALGVAAKDDRVRTVFVLSGSSALGSTDKNIMNGISVPVGYIVGGTEDIARANAFSDYEALGDRVPAMVVNRSTGEHQTVSTDAAILAEEARISLDWMDLAFYGNDEAYTALTSATVCPGCQAGVWTLTAKRLADLRR